MREHVAHADLKLAAIKSESREMAGGDPEGTSLEVVLC